MNFAKGHATLNDFVILTDRDNMTPLSADEVRWLCDRRAGIGADGLLRAVKSEFVTDWSGDDGLWFMDYRNADGSIAEMCGNGLRLFVRHLLDQGLIDQSPVSIATRAGLRSAQTLPDGQIRLGMGQAVVASQLTWIALDAQRQPAITVDVGNPHAVVFLADQAELVDLDLSRSPQYDPAVYPAGVNVEFVVARGDDELQLRVYERGVGETMSCGTGVVGAAAAHLHRQGRDSGVVNVTVPGGRLQVEVTLEQAYLSGPAMVVAHGSVVLPPSGVVRGR